MHGLLRQLGNQPAEADRDERHDEESKDFNTGHVSLPRMREARQCSTSAANSQHPALMHRRQRPISASATLRMLAAIGVTRECRVLGYSFAARDVRS